MKEKHTDSTQNRFTAYLMAAVGNKRSSYIERKIRQREREQVQVDILEKNHTDFDAQFHAYMMEKAASASGDWEILKELRSLAESEQLIKALGRLKKRDRGILFTKSCFQHAFGCLRRTYIRNFRKHCYTVLPDSGFRQKRLL